MSFQTARTFLKMIILPVILTFFLSCLLFIGGMRIGAQAQLQQDEPFFAECISQLRECAAQFTVTPADGGTE